MCLNSINLNGFLGGLGYTTEPAGNGRKHIMKGGETHFTGTAGEVWEWLRETKQTWED